MLWFLWCAVIFGDPLYFEHSPFSSQAQQQGLIRQHYLFTYHNLWESIRTYSLDSALNVGAILLVLGAVALIVFYIRRRITPETSCSKRVSGAFPFLYSVFIYRSKLLFLFLVRHLQRAPSSMLFYNTRYGIEMLAPVAILIATLVSQWSMGRAQLILQAAVRRFAEVLRRVGITLGKRSQTLISANLAECCCRSDCDCAVLLDCDWWCCFVAEW